MNATLEVFDLSGRLIQERQITNLISDLKIENRGLYLLRLRTAEGQQYYQKVVVQ